MGVVGGAVQGIDDPAGVSLALDLATLFGEHPVVREGLLEYLLDRLLGVLVSLRYQVYFSFEFDLLVLSKAVSQHLSGRLRRRDRRLQLPRQVSILP